MFMFIAVLIFVVICDSKSQNFETSDHFHRKENCMFYPTGNTINKRTAYDHHCIGSHQYKLLLTSLGGSGTHYITCLLQDLNLKFDHERIQEHGAIGWQYAVNDTYIQKPYPHHADLAKSAMNPSNFNQYYKRLFGIHVDFKNAHRETRMWKNEGDTTLEPYNPSFHTVYHIVRNPLKHIASFTSHMLPTYEFVFQAMQRLNYRGLPGTSINSLKRYGLLSLIEPKSDTGSGEEYCIWEYPNRIAGCMNSTSNNCDMPVEGNHSIWDTHRLAIAPRGHRCWLYFASMSWLFWNTLIESYADKRFRMEDEVEELIVAVCETLMVHGGEVYNNENGSTPMCRFVAGVDDTVKGVKSRKGGKDPLLVGANGAIRAWNNQYQRNRSGFGGRNYCPNRMQSNSIRSQLWGGISTVLSSWNARWASDKGGQNSSTSSTEINYEPRSKNSSDISRFLSKLFDINEKDRWIKSSKFHKFHIVNVNYKQIANIDQQLCVFIQSLARKYGYST